MRFSVDVSNGSPIFEQIARQVMFAVADGRLKPGERVPSIRAAAEDAAVNANTVARAYRGLQSDGVLQAERGSGLVVATGAAKACRAARKEVVRTRLRDVLGELRSLRVEAADVRSVVEAELKKWKPPADRDDPG